MSEGSATELRLALVCYGGVSLAIYMHGVTKELHKLVVASRRFDELGPSGVNPFGEETDTCFAYFEALRDLAADGHRLSVSIDVIAGTSAGGINGVCLAKVLARNGSQDALKSLWIDEGDLKTLLRSPAIGGWRMRAVIAALRTLRDVSEPNFPLRGDHMSRLLYDAIEAMDKPANEDRSTLVPDGGSLDLFVTMTDLYGIPVLAPTGAGGASQRETEHAQVLQFSTTGRDDALDARSTGALAFSARATSCFPGAFPPVSLDSFREEISGRGLDADHVHTLFKHRYGDPKAANTSVWFVDGGVLDNAPFDLVIKAISEKRAQSEVIRRVVYIQPDPGLRLDQTPKKSPGGPDSPPGYLPGLVKAVGKTKGSHSILRDLFTLRDLNVRVAEIGAISAMQMEQVSTAIQQAWVKGKDGATTADPTGEAVWNIDDPDDVKLLADTIYEHATTYVGAGYPAYCRLKVDEAGRRLADEISQRFVYPPDSSRSSFVRAAISAWARNRISWNQMDTEKLMELLGPVDVPYRERRLMFIQAGINALYDVCDGAPDQPRREQLDELKDKAWGLLEQVRSAPAAVVAPGLGGVIGFLGDDLSDEMTFRDPREFAAEHDAEFATVFTAYRKGLDDRLGSSIPMWEAFVALTPGWKPEHRRALLSRYLGFPLWDALIFPTIALARLPQFTPITVSQFSPLAATAIPWKNKLKGVSLGHFAAFVSAEWRENDYLWGRLDAAELILRTLNSSGHAVADSLTSTREEAITQAGRQLRRVLEEILAAESGLGRVGKLRDELTEKIATLPPG